MQLRRTAAAAAAYRPGLRDHHAGSRPASCGRSWTTGDLCGAIWLPDDGKANPADLTYALAKGARDAGVVIAERTRVTGIRTRRRRGDRGRHRGGRHRGRDRGQLRRPVGQAGRRVVRGERAAALVRALLRGDRADRRGASRPAHPARPGRLHLLQGGGGRPGGGRVRAERQAVGGARRAAVPVRVPVAARGLGPLLAAGRRERSCGSRRCAPRASRRCTTARRASPRTTSSSSARRRSAATSSSRPASTRSASPPAGGAGQALAEWILTGDPGIDLTASDIRRFAPFHGNNRWLRDRVGEILGPALRAALAEPGTGHGAPVPPLARAPPAGGGRGVLRQPEWLGAAQLLRAARGRAGHRVLLGGAELAARLRGRRAARRPHATWRCSTRPRSPSTCSPGRDAEQALQWLCTADVAVEPGLDGLHRHAERARHLRVRPDRDPAVRPEFLLVSSAATTERDKHHIATRMPAGALAALVDVTSAYAVFGVMGPRSRDLLAALSGADLSDEAFPFGASRQIGLGYFTVRATRITYVGELGWELYVPCEFAVGVFGPADPAGARVRAGQRGLLRHRVDAAGEGLPGLRAGADPGLRAGGGRAWCSPASCAPTSASWAARQWRRPGPKARARRLVSLVASEPGTDDVGRRAGAARRRARGPGHVGRLGRGPRRLRRPGLHPAIPAATW